MSPAPKKNSFHENFEDLSALMPEPNRIEHSKPLEDREWPDVTEPKKRLFLQAFRNTGTIRLAVEQAHISRATFNRWMMNDSIFADAVNDAKQDYWDLAEAKLAHMALRRDNIAAISIMLQMANRYQYGHRIEHTGKGGGPIQVESVSYREMIMDKIDSARKKLHAAGFDNALPEPSGSPEAVEGEYTESES